MQVDLEVTGRVDLPSEVVYAWWTDYREDDHEAPQFAPFRWGPREILERDAAGRVIRLRDPGRILLADTTSTSTLEHDPPRAVRLTSEGPVGSFRASYAFERLGPAPPASPPSPGVGPTGRTRIRFTVHGDVRAAWARRLVRVPGLARAAAKADLEGHLLDLRRDAREGRVPGVPSTSAHVGEW